MLSGINIHQTPGILSKKKSVCWNKCTIAFIFNFDHTLDYACFWWRSMEAYHVNLFSFLYLNGRGFHIKFIFTCIMQSTSMCRIISSKMFPGGINTQISKKVYRHVKVDRDMYLVVFVKYPYISIHFI